MMIYHNVKAAHRRSGRRAAHAWHKRQPALLHRFCCAILLFVAACTPVIPATTPPQLQHTPGSFVVIHERLIEAEGIQVAYPAGWRVVKSSIAAHPLSFVIISPDDTILIEWRVAADGCVQATPMPDQITRAAAFALPKKRYVCIIGTAPAEQESRFVAAWAQITESLRKH